MNSVQVQWEKIRDEYNAAVDEFGYDDPRTIALEEAEAEACERYLALS